MKRGARQATTKRPARLELKVVRIGNSRGVRLPKAVLERYDIKDTLVLEARDEGLLLLGRKDKRLTWEETYRDMAREKEDWSDLDAAVADGIDPAERWSTARRSHETRVPKAACPGRRKVLIKSPSPHTVIPGNRLNQGPSGTSGSSSSQRARSSS